MYEWKIALRYVSPRSVNWLESLNGYGSFYEVKMSGVSYSFSCMGKGLKCEKFRDLEPSIIVFKEIKNFSSQKANL